MNNQDLGETENVQVQLDSGTNNQVIYIAIHKAAGSSIPCRTIKNADGRNDP